MSPFTNSRFKCVIANLAVVVFISLLMHGIGKNAEEETAFEAIVKYWKQEFSQATAECHRLADGPNGNRTHVPVPLHVESLYLQNYSEAFLAQKKESHSTVERLVADDLLTLKNRQLFSYYGRVSYSQDKEVECRFYVVDNGRTEQTLLNRRNILPP